LIAGQAVARGGDPGDPARARAIYLDFVSKAPEALLLPEVGLAIARTYEQEDKWDMAIDKYDDWLKRFTNSPTRPRAEYLRAWANFQAGRETNAYQLFTNFVARFPNDECAPLARCWVADYYFRGGKWKEAEENYQQLFLSTNWPHSRFSYEARLMAGRTAVARQGWTDAIGYFTNLTGDVKCPADIWIQATIAYGNVWMLQDSTNKLADYSEAIRIFDRVLARFPTNQLAVLALGEKASCLLQWARTAPQFEAVAAEFQRIITNNLADAKARGIARIGLAVVLEKQAQQKAGPEQIDLLRRALQSYLDVFYYNKDLGEEERPSAFLVKYAGWEAGRLTETLQNWSQAIQIYEHLHVLFPGLRPTIEKKLIKAYENLARSKS
jgi:TolA-binding protein